MLSLLLLLRFSFQETATQSKVESAPLLTFKARFLLIKQTLIIHSLASDVSQRSSLTYQL